MSREQLVNWIDSKIKKSPVEIDLVHSRGDKVETFEPEENETCETLVEKIYQSAQDDARGMAGPQSYWILIRPPGMKDVVGRKSITVDGEDHARGRGNESPDEYGLTGMSMRHAEIFMRQAQQATERAMLVVQRENDRHSALESERARLDIERMAMQRQLAQETAEQRANEARIYQATQREQFIMRQLEVIFPVIMSQTMSDKDGPKFSHEGEVLLAFARSCSPELQLKIAGIFDPASRSLLGAIAQGEVTPQFLPLAVQRLMSSMTEDTYRAIWNALETDEQKGLFKQLFHFRKHGLAGFEFEQEEKRMQAPRYDALPSPQSNGSVTEASSATDTSTSTTAS